MENLELTQKGLNLLLGSLSAYIGREMNRVYHNDWWNQVLYKLSDQFDLPNSGEYGDLIDSLDLANCLRLIDRSWADVFKERLDPSSRAWAKELMGVRNLVAHHGQQDMDQPVAERALDTMALLCKKIDPETEKKIREIYTVIREKAGVTVTYVGVPQPQGITGGQSGLLSLIGTDAVQKTALTKRLIVGGKDTVFPVYRVRLNTLFYNDQNDRVATWISRYESENGKDSLSALDKIIYNRIIEDFIVDSNPDAIRKTQKNMEMVGQREAGVTLFDGRIVDGNRRFTCLRRLQRESPETLYFETVILDLDIVSDSKKIKILELELQHGTEKPVDYDLIDYAIGTYRDIELTHLLTVEEYADSANETPGDVKKRIDIARVVCEFLNYFNLSDQYHIAREYQVYSLFQEMLPLLKKVDATETGLLKEIAFNNAVLNVIADQRKFIRDIKALITKNAYHDYFKQMEPLCAKVKDNLNASTVKTAEDLRDFSRDNATIANDMLTVMERALFQAREEQLLSKPSENIARCADLLSDIDSRFFSKLEPDEKEKVKSGFAELVRMITSFQKQL